MLGREDREMRSGGAPGRVNAGESARSLQAGCREARFSGRSVSPSSPWRWYSGWLDWYGGNPPRGMKTHDAVTEKSRGKRGRIVLWS